jgi:hypothetical protein
MRPAVPLVLVGGGEEGGVGAAVAHGHAEALRGAERDVDAELTCAPKNGVVSPSSPPRHFWGVLRRKGNE